LELYGGDGSSEDWILWGPFLGAIVVQLLTCPVAVLGAGTFYLVIIGAAICAVVLSFRRDHRSGDTYLPSSSHQPAEKRISGKDDLNHDLVKSFGGVTHQSPLSNFKRGKVFGIIYNKVGKQPSLTW
jgi:hypothetical protein